jgi:O-antigen/teichoic acid export membrane protein
MRGAPPWRKGRLGEIGRWFQGSHGQSALLFGSRALASVLQFGINVYLARVLGVGEFGRYSFAISLLTFASLFFDFGYWSSGARLLSIESDETRQRALVGALCLVGGVASIAFVGVVLLLGVISDQLFHDRVGVVLRAVSLAAPVMIAPLVVEQVLKALRRSELLGAWTLASRVLFLASVAALSMSGPLDARKACLAYLVGGFGGAVLVAIRVRPRLRGSTLYLRRLAAERQRFGRAFYLGKMLNLVIYRTDTLLLAHFRDAAAVGQYNLANSFANILAVFAQSGAAIEFRGFATGGPIPRQVHKWNLAGIVLGAVTVLAAGELVVWHYLGAAYSLAGMLLIPALFVSAFQGAYQPYNNWLLANGYGEELGRFLFAVAAINALANIMLIPVAGALGAVLASLLGMGSYLLLARQTYLQKCSVSA